MAVGFLRNLCLFNFRYQEFSDFDSFIESILHFFRSSTFARITELNCKVGNSFYKRLKFLKSRVVFFTVNDKGSQVVDFSQLLTLLDKICFQPFLNSLLAVEPGLVLNSFLRRCLRFGAAPAGGRRRLFRILAPKILQFDQYNAT